MQRLSSRFTIGFMVDLAIALLLNVLSHLWARLNDVKDGYDTLGFPFVFQRQGGFAGLYEFYVPALLLDIVVALIVAYAVGRACTGRLRRAV